MVSTTEMRRKLRLGRNEPKSLSSIPEERSCREWHILGSPSVAASRSRKQLKNGVSEEDIATTTVSYKLVDIERRGNKLQGLARSEKLHQLARLHANKMAKQGRVFHSVGGLAELQQKLQNTLVGENVQRGNSVMAMHKTTMKDLIVNRDNILGEDFHEYGVASARGIDGKLYLCQYFR